MPLLQNVVYLEWNSTKQKTKKTEKELDLQGTPYVKIWGELVGMTWEEAQQLSRQRLVFEWYYL